jgi:anti-sigma regulatory factor (Ser/Thr protein kinase)
MGETAHHRLPSPKAESVRDARDWLEVTCRAWAPHSRRDALLLVTSELMTNALLHGRGSIGLDLTYSRGHVRIEVTDDGDGPIGPTESSSEMPHGRGLQIVGILSRHWGAFDERGHGKTVWADVEIKVPQRSGNLGLVLSPRGGAVADTREPGFRPNGGAVPAWTYNE